MTVKIVTDSGADIPEDLVADLGITVVPLMVSFGDQTYRDGVDLSADDFYHRLIEGGVMPKTSQPSVGEFVEAYNRINGDSDQVVSVHLSSKLSGTLNSASQAVAQEGLGDIVQLIDSRQASMGLGFSVIAGAKAAMDGASVTEVAAVVKSVLDRTRVWVLFDTLTYLERGGRIGKASSLLGSVLRIKPILTIDDGEIATALKVRTFKKGVQSLRHLLKECGRLDEAAFLYTTDPTEASNMSGTIDNDFANDGERPAIRISPAIGTHGGPGLLGAVCVSSQEQ